MRSSLARLAGVSTGTALATGESCRLTESTTVIASRRSSAEAQQERRGEIGQVRDLAQRTMLVALLTALVLLTSTVRSLRTSLPANSTQAYFALVLCSPSPPQGSPSEDTYRTSTVPQPQPLRTVHQPATLGLSVVVPAYNEKHRLGHMLRAAVDYLESVPVQSSSGSKVDVVRGSYEVIIVDDGSKDGTAQVALDLAKELQEKWERVEGKKRQMRGEIKVVTLVRNRGKGGSVKHVRPLLLHVS